MNPKVGKITFDLKKNLEGRPIDIIGDIVEFTSFENELTEIDGILHLAAISRVIDAEFNKNECTRVNVLGTKNILNQAPSLNCKWFIFGSSREVYGEPNSFPVEEKGGVNPINYYGIEKVNGENLVEESCNKNNMAHSILRFSNVYGHSGL